MTFTPERFCEEMIALVGTRYRHQGRSLALGVDCVGAIIYAATQAGWEARVPELSLQNDYAQFLETDEALKAALLGECIEVGLDDLQFGDIVSMTFDPSMIVNGAQHSLHCGVLVPPPANIRAGDPRRSGFYFCQSVSGHGVVHTIWANEWKKRATGFYRFRGWL